MCSFKHCRKTGQCFLAKVSPCPDAQKVEETPASDAGLHYDGFLDPNKLLAELGFVPSEAKKVEKKRQAA